MFARYAAVLLGLTISLPVAAQELTADHARHFVVGKTFAYTCFDGSRGAGRVHADGSVRGSIQFQGQGPVRRAALPAHTLRVKGEKVCASLKGLPFEPCFNLVRTSSRSFRGSIAGFGFAWCEFTRGHPRTRLLRTAKRHRDRPLALRSTLDE